MKNRDRIIAIVCFVTFILIIIGGIVYFSLSRTTESNQIDSSKWQIRILYRDINIRSESNLSSDILGHVKQGEIYDVLDFKTDNTYNWYLITTKSNITGYVGSKINAPFVEESGNIKKSDITLKYYNDYAVFKDDNITLDNLECISSYGCDISYEILDNEYIKYTATDSLGKSVYKTQRYYMVYQIKDYEEENDEILANITFNNKEDGLYINIKSTLKNDVSKMYVSDVFYYMLNVYSDINILGNPNLNNIELDKVTEMFKTGNLDLESANTYSELTPGIYNFKLKEEYMEHGITKGNYINIDYFIPKNINYYFTNQINYFEFGYNAGLKSAEGFNSFKSYLFMW